MIDCTIRDASAKDGAACAGIYGYYVLETTVSFELEPPDAYEMAGRIEASNAAHGWLLAEIEGEIVGYAYGSPHRTRPAYNRSCDVSAYLARDFAGKGIGSALYEALLRRLAERGYHAAFAGIALPNPGSIAFHEKFGFEQIGIYREVGRKFDRWHDVGWWQRLL